MNLSMFENREKLKVIKLAYANFPKSINCIIQLKRTTYQSSWTTLPTLLVYANKSLELKFAFLWNMVVLLHEHKYDYEERKWVYQFASLGQIPDNLTQFKELIRPVIQNKMMENL